MNLPSLQTWGYAAAVPARMRIELGTFKMPNPHMPTPLHTNAPTLSPFSHIHIHSHAHTRTHTHTHILYIYISLTYTHTHTHTHAHMHSLNPPPPPQTSDLPIAESMIANSYVRHSNLCWDYTIQQLARLMNRPPLFLAWYPPHSGLK